MDENELPQLYTQLDETIRAIVALEYPLEPGDEGSVLVAEWVVSTGIVGFSSSTNPNGDVQILAPEGLPLWRAKGLLGSAKNYLDTIESHNYLVGMHADMDGDEEE